MIKNIIKAGPEELIQMDLWSLLSDKELLMLGSNKKRKSSITISDLNSSMMNQTDAKKQAKGSMFKPKIPNSSR